LFRRVEIEAETTRLQAHRDAMAAEVVRIQNLTVRLSDDQLDLDLLDERARTVLGRSRVDEIIIR
jgi:cell division protein FtsB